MDEKFKQIKRDLYSMQVSGDNVLLLADALVTLDNLYSEYKKQEQAVHEYCNTDLLGKEDK